MLDQTYFHWILLKLIALDKLCFHIYRDFFFLITFLVHNKYLKSAQQLYNARIFLFVFFTGSNYGPPGLGRLIYFVDDLNLPEVDPYDTQSAIALLRQHMEYSHVYDLSKMTIRNVANTQV